MDQEAKVVNPDRQIDCTGLFCPMPIVKTREAMTRMTAGQVLAMLSDDPASDPDMRSWAQNTGHELLEVTRTGAVYRFVIRKTR
jgi:tRNA 2-thiouridine synthesizing protein A